MLPLSPNVLSTAGAAPGRRVFRHTGCMFPDAEYCLILTTEDRVLAVMTTDGRVYEADLGPLLTDLDEL